MSVSGNQVCVFAFARGKFVTIDLSGETPESFEIRLPCPQNVMGSIYNDAAIDHEAKDFLVVDTLVNGDIQVGTFNDKYVEFQDVRWNFAPLFPTSVCLCKGQFWLTVRPPGVATKGVGIVQYDRETRTFSQLMEVEKLAQDIRYPILWPMDHRNCVVLGGAGRKYQYLDRTAQIVTRRLRQKMDKWGFGMEKLFLLPAGDSMEGICIESDEDGIREQDVHCDWQSSLPFVLEEFVVTTNGWIVARDAKDNIQCITPES
jgi:hypothetical protein